VPGSLDPGRSLANEAAILQTGIAAAVDAKKMINDSACANRILEIVRRLQEEIKNREVDFQSRLKQAESEWRAERQNFQEKIAALERALAPRDKSDHATHEEVPAIVQSETVRVQSRLDEIERTLADPATELGSEIRLNRERAELQAYLKGLRYSVGEVSLETLHS
jgi:hypothetical protein